MRILSWSMGGGGLEDLILVYSGEDLNLVRLIDRLTLVVKMPCRLNILSSYLTSTSEKKRKLELYFSEI